MAVTTGQKSLANINSEVASVNSESLNTLTSNAIKPYTGGNSTVVANNLSATPNSMNEFSGYVHTQNFLTHTYSRYYNSNRNNTSDGVSSNPYKATTGSSNPSITITSSARTMTTTASNTDDFQAFASAGADFKVRRNSSYLWLECRNFVGGLPSARAMYRQNGTIQSASNGQVGVGDGTTLGNQFVRIMRIQTGINPGGLSVMISGSNSVTAHTVGTGGSANQYLSTLSGSQATVGNYANLTVNNTYVGVRYYVQADQTAPPYGARSTTASAARILTVNIRASGYYDQQIASIIVGGSALAVGNSYQGCNLCCVHDSMLVSTEEDMKSVYDIEIGDLIVSHNFETGQDEIVPVTDKIIVDRDVDYKVNNLIMTEDHPVYLEDGRKASINPEATKINYKQIVDQLQIGDKMMTLDGLEEITSIEKYEGNHKNFALQTKHNNFYANGHLVDSVIDRGES